MASTVSLSPEPSNHSPADAAAYSSHPTVFSHSGYSGAHDMGQALEPAAPCKKLVNHNITAAVRLFFVLEVWHKALL
jgi:hypothetical protein